MCDAVGCSSVLLCLPPPRVGCRPPPTSRNAPACAALLLPQRPLQADSVPQRPKTARTHTGRRVGASELHAFLGQSIKVWGFNPRGTRTAKVMQTKIIRENQENIWWRLCTNTQRQEKLQHRRSVCESSRRKEFLPGDPVVLGQRQVVFFEDSAIGRHMFRRRNGISARRQWSRHLCQCFG